jgi:hypothetical protein
MYPTSVSSQSSTVLLQVEKGSCDEKRQENFTGAMTSESRGGVLNEYWQRCSNCTKESTNEIIS